MSGIVKVLVFIILPAIVVITFFSVWADTKFFVFPNPGAWIFWVFCGYAGFKADDWFPPKSNG